MNLKRSVVKAVAAGLSVLMMTGCGDIVIKVQKKPKDVDLSALENFSALNLQDSEDFLKHMDSLKAVAVSFIMNELANRDYRGEVRTAIRNYRTFLIERAQADVKIDDSFYGAGDECRQFGLNFNMHEANAFLGLILKTAVLSKLSEVNAAKLNPGLSKEVAAIGQMILMELGIEIEGDVNVTAENGVTTTSGSFSLKLAALDGENIDEAMKKRDEVEVLSMSFNRALGENYIGSFDATIELAHQISEEATETLQAKMAIERKAVEDRFAHSISFSVGVKDAEPRYTRSLMFEQVNENKHQLKVTDTIMPGTTSEKVYITMIDIKAGTQCKLSTGGNGDDNGKGDEGGFIPDEPKKDEPKKDEPKKDEPKKDEPKKDEPKKDEPKKDEPKKDEPVKTGKPGDKDPPVDNDDDKKDDDAGKPGNNPGQNPGQHPGQHPG